VLERGNPKAILHGTGVQGSALNLMLFERQYTRRVMRFSVSVSSLEPSSITELQLDHANRRLMVLYFHELLAQVRTGWEGAKVWRAQDGEIVLRAHWQRRRVALDVELYPAQGDDEYRTAVFATSESISAFSEQLEAFLLLPHMAELRSS
jgi:hypothetical protein